MGESMAAIIVALISDLFEWLTETLQRHEWCPAGLGVRILPASLGDLAGAYGAARQAILSQSGNVGTVSC